MVVAIIGITAAIAAPALTEAMADRRAGEAMHGLVRIGARARSEAMATGRAHILVYTAAAFGSVQLWRGRSNACFQNQWATFVTGACATDVDCLEAHAMSRYDHGTHQVRMNLQGAGAAVLCFQPDGEMLISNSGLAGPYAPTPLVAGSEGVLFTIVRLVNGSPDGVQRQVVFPFGGTPRVAL